MKKYFSLFLTIALFVMTSIKLNAQNFMSYKVNGVLYEVSEEQFISYGTFSTNLQDEKPLRKTFSASVSGIYGIEYQADFQIYLDTNAVPKVDTFKLDNGIAYLKRKHIASLGMTRKVKDDYQFYKSESNTKGNITITKVDGDIIEGTFEGALVPQYPLAKTPLLMVTEGKFRISVEMMAD